jgi:hypothetical protein
MSARAEPAKNSPAQRSGANPTCFGEEERGGLSRLCATRAAAQSDCSEPLSTGQRRLSGPMSRCPRNRGLRQTTPRASAA